MFPKILTLKAIYKDTKSHKTRVMILRVDTAVISNVTKFNGNVLSGFQLSDKEFIGLFGTGNGIQAFVNKYVFNKTQQGYCIDQTNYKYNRYKLYDNIGLDVLDIINKDSSKTLNKLGVLTNKNTIVTQEDTMYRNQRGKNLKCNIKTDGSGRVYDATTNLPKVYEKVIFQGSYSYDIDAAAPTILSQMYTNITGITLTHIPNYIKNKVQLRNEWANELDVSVQDIKIIVNSLFFGGVIPSEAQLNANFDFTFRIQDTLLVSQIKLLLKNDSFMGIRNETKMMMSTIADHYRTKDKHLTNAAGFTKHYPIWTARKVCFHLYVGVEVQILHFMSQHMLLQSITFIRTKHDSIMCDGDFIPSELADMVYDFNGYNITYTKEQL